MLNVYTKLRRIYYFFLLSLFTTSGCSLSLIGQFASSNSGSNGATLDLNDNFNDNWIDTARWYVANADGLLVQEVGQQFEVSPLASTAGAKYSGVNTDSSVYQVDFRGKEATLNIVQTVANALGVEMYFFVSVDTGNFIQITYQIGNIYFDRIINGVRTSPSLVFSAVNHKYWRLRHISGTDQLVWETSPDASTWTVQRTEANPFDMSAVYIGFGAGTWQSVAAPGTAIFDDFTTTGVYSPL